MADAVIAGIDAREQSRDGLALANLLARTLGRPLVLARVVSPTPPGWGGVEFERVISEEGRELLDRAAATLDDPTVERRVLEWPSPAWALRDLAEDTDASVLVVGSCHRGTVGRLLLGGVAHGLVTGAPCAVGVAPLGYRERPPDALRLIGVAYDGGPEADEALDFAIELATASGAGLRLWFVVEPTGAGGASPGRYAELTRYFHDWGKKRLAVGIDRVPEGVVASSEVLEGDPASAIRDAADDVDLLVCGSRGYGALRRVFAGSTARRLLDGAPCPVIVVPRPAKATASRVRHEAR